ncbi:hypothetical protein CCR75_007556 [Bremia lactucae]|uniref:Uncharacterized protein n=1 Tax=Bremia lactucae TaxID=4779 RepID=A0A976NZZ2_BRELC|nr:hypothetical protein CCR75_007556 [Bremia lactucae]
MWQLENGVRWGREGTAVTLKQSESDGTLHSQIPRLDRKPLKLDATNMPLKWFRGHCNSEIEESRSTTHIPTSKSTTSATKHRFRRSRSHGHGLHSVISSSTQEVHSTETQRRLLYQSKTSRRFTIHGISYHSKHTPEAGWSCTSETSQSTTSSPPGLTRMIKSHFVKNSSRTAPCQSPPRTQMTLDSNPSIIFIDCPP